MDYLKQVISGSGFKRKDITIIKEGGPLTESGSVNRQDFGGAFVLLKASSTNPCRIRLYSDESSMVLDAPRSPTNFNISESVALIADIVLDNTQPSLTFNPPVLGNTFSGGNTFYNISGSQAYTAVTLTVYPIGNTGNSTTGRDTLFVSRSLISNIGYGVSGSITSPKSFLILQGNSTYNMNPDQQWQLGNNNDLNGWEFFYQTASVAELHTTVDPTKVTKPFPEISVGSTQYAAKIATRTGTLYKDGGFYYLPVENGKTYRMSGWFWCKNTTQNPTDCGYFALPVSSSGAAIFPYLHATASGATEDWQYVSKQFTVGPNTASVLIGTFMDLAYPNGYGLTPECTGYYQDPLGCPGYGWYTGFTIENVTDFRSRLRLYSTNIQNVPVTETTRSFDTASADGVNLIADMMFDSASLNYPLVPILEAYTQDTYNPIVGTNTVGYILENKSTTTSIASGSLNTILKIYKLED